MATRISFEEWLAVSEISFEWADAYDAKDFDRFIKIFAPKLNMDYTDVMGKKFEDVPANEFVSQMKSAALDGGNPLMDTQHLLGGSKWVKRSEESITGYHQLRAAHLYGCTPGHGHAVIEHHYRKIDGEWKLEGLRPIVRWVEGDETVAQGRH